MYRGKLQDGRHHADAAGALCLLYQELTGRGRWLPSNRCYKFALGDVYASEIYPPEPVLRWAGLTMKDIEDITRACDTSMTFASAVHIINQMRSDAVAV